LDIQSLFRPELEALFDKIFAFLRYHSLLGIGKGHGVGFQHDPFLEDAHLAHRISKRFLSVDHLEIYDSDAPHVHFGGNYGHLLFCEALGRQVPVGAYTLGGEFDGIFFGGFAQSEIGDFDASFVEEDVLGFEVVVDYFVR
jgi:hypothetical protein